MSDLGSLSPSLPCQIRPSLSSQQGASHRKNIIARARERERPPRNLASEAGSRRPRRPFGGWAHFSVDIFTLPNCIIGPVARDKSEHIKLYNIMVHVFLFFDCG